MCGGGSGQIIQFFKQVVINAKVVLESLDCLMLVWSLSTAHSSFLLILFHVGSYQEESSQEAEKMPCLI